jgi:hypothetical protein
MLDKEGIKKYVILYKDILSKRQIVVTDKDLDNIYHLILLTFDLDDLYDSLVGGAFPPENRSLDSLSAAEVEATQIETLCKRSDELEKIEQKMISLMPDRQPIALNSIALVFAAMDAEAHADLSESLARYLSICGKSIGAQLITGYLASKNRVALNIWLSPPIVKLNDDIDDIIRLANDYLDITVDVKRVSTEVSQIKSTNFFRSKFEFKAYLYYRYVSHKIRYYLYTIGFRCLNIFSQRQDYLVAIECIESVLDFGVKAYIADKKSFRSPEDK